MRSGYDDALLPGNFDDAAHARDWLPIDWHPDQFDVEETNTALAIAVAEPVAVTGELAELAEQLDHRGIRLLREVLGRPFSHGPTDVSDVEAARLTETYRTFLDVIGDGVTLTAAGYLPPTVVEQVAERSGISEWWIGKANREDLTHPVAEIRTTARALGLVSRPQGPPVPDRRRRPLPGPAGAVAAHRWSPSLGHQGRRAPGGLDGTGRGRQRRTSAGVAQRDQRSAVRSRVGERARPVLTAAGKQPNSGRPRAARRCVARPLAGDQGHRLRRRGHRACGEPGRMTPGRGQVGEHSGERLDCRAGQVQRLLRAPRSHQSPGGSSRTIRAVNSTCPMLQNFQSSFAAREY